MPPRGQTWTVYNKATGARRVLYSSSEALRYIRTGEWQTSRPRATGSSGGTASSSTGSSGGTASSSTGSSGGTASNSTGVLFPALTASQLIASYKSGNITYEVLVAALSQEVGPVRPGGDPRRLRHSIEEIHALIGGPQQPELPWQQYVQSAALKFLTSAGTKAGITDPGTFAENFLAYNWNRVSSFLNAMINTRGWRGEGVTNPQVQQQLWGFARDLLTEQWQWGGIDSSSSGGFGGGGGGNLAGKFDVQALAGDIRSMWQLYLRDEPDQDAVELAQEYVDQVVANPNQAYDFATWVKGKMKQDQDWGFVFRNVPSGISDEDYIREYAEAVTSVLGPAQDSSDIIRQLASLNASGNDVAGRLRKHPHVQKSNQFMSKVEERYRSARKMLGAMF